MIHPHTQKFRTIALVLSLISIIMIALACAPVNPTPSQPLDPVVLSNDDVQDVLKNSDIADEEFDGVYDVKTIKTQDELDALLKKGSLQNNYYGGGMLMRTSMDMAVMEESAASAPMATKSFAGAAVANDGASDFSTTNIQVEGVDEADFIKNDGKYIYMVKENLLLIIEAFPADEAKIIAELEFEQQPRELFIKGDKLVLILNVNEQVMRIAQYDYTPRPQYQTVTKAIVYDVSDRSKPSKIESTKIDGYYMQSRMIGDHVYIIAQQHTYVGIPMPRVVAGSRIMTPEIDYFAPPTSSENFNIVTSIHINDPSEVQAKTFMLGHSTTIYASSNHLYIAQQNQYPYMWGSKYMQSRFEEVILPLLPSPVRTTINSLPSDAQWDAVAQILQDMYNEMQEKEKKSLTEKIETAVQKYEFKMEQERRKSIIHKIRVDKGDIEYVARGEVEGYLQNQFSLDEHQGNLRVATTTYVWTERSTMYNNVYVLDGDMEVIGSLEDIAPEERIYSTRFIGDRLYMVTFKNIDPLFVIDLSDANNPTILGELKIPGFSEYLHPYDEDHIIGVGKETESTDNGGFTTGGVKLALFDVSDVTSPKEVDKIELGQQRSDSESLRDHKAFLFDKEQDLVVIPIREVTGRFKDPERGYYRDDVWFGAYALDITPEDGFSIRGKISHGSDDNWWGSSYAIRRSLYMDDVLYTVSNNKILMNDIDSIAEINEVPLPSSYNNGRPPIPFFAEDEVEAVAIDIADSDEADEVIEVSSASLPSEPATGLAAVSSLVE